MKLGFIPVTHQRAYPFGFSAYLISMCQKHLREGEVGSQMKHIQSSVVTVEIFKRGMILALTLQLISLDR
jgi:hypothetical protein